jgi:RNA polymerase sigma-70 factor (ECF subfamily)
MDDPVEAEDATQETFISALRAIDRFRGDASLQTWLFSIALNTCRGRLRKRRAKKRLMSVLHGIDQSKPLPPPEPEDQVIQSEEISITLGAVYRLDDKRRIPLILRYYHELSIAEIAEILNVSQRTVHTHLRKALEILRHDLEEDIS